MQGSVTMLPVAVSFTEHTFQNVEITYGVLRLHNYYYFTSAASSSTLWSRFSPPPNLVNGHMSTMWFMVCHWLQSQEGDWERPHLCKLA